MTNPAAAAAARIEWPALRDATSAPYRSDGRRPMREGTPFNKLRVARVEASA